jgi:hypothetical protein
VITITKSDFQDWQNNPVTKAFYSAAQFRIDECKDILSYSAGADYMQDRVLVGMIQAYREVQEFRVEEEEGSEE